MTRRRIFKSILKNIGNPTISPCYNGNISSVFWRTAQNDASNALVSSPERGYLFTYDGLSRLKDAVYGEGTSLNQNRNRFNEQITGYDKMGNILGLLRYGQTGTDSYGLIDNLNLTYHGNQLQSVYDNATNCVFGNGMEFKDAAHETVEYAYDKNGNLTKDLNKNITGIQYNILNLPSHISFADGSSIEYEYAADGSKVRTTHVINNDTTTTVYCGNAIYENGSLTMLLNEAGYYSFQDKKFHFYIKDHQGNVRVVADEDGQVDEVNDYYPFGGLMSNACNNVQPYKYNDKELDRKGGLDWYDYGARMYDATLGRFMKTDRFSEKYVSLSPYQYGANNPVNNIEINGDSIIILSNPNGLIDCIKSYFGFDTQYQKVVKANLSQLKEDGIVEQIINSLESSKNIHYITMPKGREGNSSSFDIIKAEKNIPQGSVVKYDPYTETDVKGEKRNPIVGLVHELTHSNDADKGTVTNDKTENNIKIMEVRAVNMENRIRKRTGDLKRTKYAGKEIPQKHLEW